MHCGLGMYHLKGNVYIHEQDFHLKICKMLSLVTMLTSFNSELSLFKRKKKYLTQLAYRKAITSQYKKKSVVITFSEQKNYEHLLHASQVACQTKDWAEPCLAESFLWYVASKVSQSGSQS